MKSLDQLIEHLKNDSRVKAYNAIEEKLLKHPYYQEKYQAFLNSQKALVQAKHYTSSAYKRLKEKYENQLKELQSDPLIHQYLTLQEELNDFLKTIIETIELAVNRPFNED